MTRRDQRDGATLRDFITTMDKTICMIFDTTGEVVPMWHCETASGEQLVLSLPPGINKDTIALLVRSFFVQVDVVRYIFVDEAWQLDHVTTNEEMREVMRIGVSNHPDRIEVLLYQAEDETGEMLARRVITRPRKGKAKLGPLEIERPIECGGRMTGLLPQRGTLQ